RMHSSLSPPPLTPTTLRAGSVALALALLTSCSSPEAENQSEVDEGAVAPEETNEENDSDEEAEEENTPFTVAFGGDVMFEGILRPLLDEPSTALDPISEQLSAADLTMVNLETAITEGGNPAPDKEFVFRAPAEALERSEERRVGKERRSGRLADMMHEATDRAL